MEPQALQIITPNEENTIALNEEVLHRIFTRDEIKDRYISIISITGVFRQGKSFILNFLLRYLRRKYVQKQDAKEWLRAEDGPLSGFSWAPGSRRHTTGIHMWSEIFLAELPGGEKVAIVLLDTQGAFDNQTTVTDCATIFTLSTLISSVQIYNVMRGIKQYDLTHLQCFGGYGKLLTDGGSAPFQNLHFLVRDWACPYEKPYGAVGGSALLEEVLGDNKSPEVKAQVDNIKDLFTQMSCFLLPYPGRVVDTSPNFDGDLNDIDDVFKEQVQEFVTLILAPENLVLKTIKEEKIKAGDFLYYLEEYANILKEGNLPPVETIVKATVEAHFKAAASRAFKFYKKRMDCDSRNPRCLTRADLMSNNAVSKMQALDYYEKLKKFEDTELEEKYLKELKNNMDTEFEKYHRINEDKRRQMEERKKRMEERIRLTSGSSQQSSSGGGGLSLSTAEKAGTAVAVIGGIAALAFGASKLFSSSRSNND